LPSHTSALLSAPLLPTADAVEDVKPSNFRKPPPPVPPKTE
jgi:hypothetical protein